ncbi:MAG: BtpA/SgcQ family protein [Phycisphaerae bacterium]|jgi:membrane complex biogenesis BtpA family protein
MIDLPSPALIGVIHLPALPGSPSQSLSMDEVLRRALADARTLQDANFDAAIVENLGDLPLPRNTLPPPTLAAMAVVADHVRRATSLTVGINALRNDALAALGIAAATHASFIRVNVHVGVCATDQGTIEGRADETLRYRKQLAQRIAVLADVHVKHAVPISEPDIARAARDAAYRGLADALILTGPATGEPVDPDDLRRVREAVPDRRLFTGSGVTAETVASYLALSSGVIVGTGLKAGRDPANPIDADLAKAVAVASGRG